MSTFTFPEKPTIDVNAHHEALDRLIAEYEANGCTGSLYLEVRNVRGQKTSDGKWHREYEVTSFNPFDENWCNEEPDDD